MVGLTLLPAGDLVALCRIQADGSAPDKMVPAGRSLLDPDAPRGRTDRPFDVYHYRIDLRITPDSTWVGGTVTADLVATGVNDSLKLDLLNNMVVSACRVDGQGATFDHDGDLLKILPPDGALVDGDSLRIEVDYSGFPIREGFVGYRRSNFVDEAFVDVLDRPVLMTLSEPDGARSWWPCHDNPFDAASVEMAITLPDSLSIGLPGRQTESISWPNGWKRQTNYLSSPIPAYLVSIAASNYVAWEDSVLLHRWPGNEEVMVPLEHLVTPIAEVASRNSWQNTGQVLQTLEDLFGPYPFSGDKYGHAMFVFGGAMEHPTLSSMGQGTVSEDASTLTGGPAGEGILVHEAAHQWFGDCVRIERWGEIWLNEGIARWCEALWFEAAYGEAAYRERMADIRSDSYRGSVRDPEVLFGATVYNKGAWILHQLRTVMGRDSLILALRNYVTDPALRFGAVRTADLQGHCEAVYGADLSWYFDPWLDRERLPQLEVDWAAGPGGVRLVVEQPEANFYRLPLPLRLLGANGASVDTVMWLESSREPADFDPGFAVEEVLVDPNGDWLLDLEVEALAPNIRFVLEAPYPNPFNPNLRIELEIWREGPLHLDIYDARGRTVRRLYEGTAFSGSLSLDWDGLDDGGKRAGSGTYYLRISSSGQTEVRAASLLR